MDRARTVVALAVGVPLVVLGLVRALLRDEAPASVSASGSDLAPTGLRSDAARIPQIRAVETAQSIAIGTSADAATPSDPEPILRASIGMGKDGFGFEAAREGVLRGPSAPDVSAEGLALLDPIRGELRRFSKDGSPLGALVLPSKHVVEAIAISDGKTLLFERSEAGQGLVVIDRMGAVSARMPIAASVANEDTDVSRIVVRGGTVYAETNGSGPLHAVGTTDGVALPGTTTVDGLPTRDDRFLLSAGITNEDEGRAWINASDRTTGTHRWTKELRFADEATAVGFLDDDGAGHGWVVVLVGGKPGSFVDAAVCFDVASGTVIASHAVAVDDPPWQSFRDFSVGPDGTLYALRRSKHESRVLAFSCQNAR